MNKLMLATAMVTALSSGSLMAKEWKEVRIGVEGAYPPFSWTEPSGEVKGFDIDIANALCEEMKVKCTLVKQDWDGIIPALLADSAAISDGLLKKEGGDAFEFVGPKLTDPKWFGEGAGIAVRKADKDLKEKFNAAILALRANGKYKAINDKYFDFDVYGE